MDENWGIQYKGKNGAWEFLTVNPDAENPTIVVFKSRKSAQESLDESNEIFGFQESEYRIQPI